MLSECIDPITVEGNAGKCPAATLPRIETVAPDFLHAESRMFGIRYFGHIIANIFKSYKRR